MSTPVLASRKPSAGSAPRSRRRRLAWAALVVVALLVVAATTLPAPIARHLLADRLEALGIAVEGLETLEIGVLEGRAALGPVRLLAAGAEPADVARIEVEVGLGDLADDRLVLERVTLRSVRLRVGRDSADRLTINRRPLALAPGGAASREAVRSLLGGWDLGIETLVVTDVGLRYEGARGDALAVEVERFTLASLRSWEPETPASFELEARVGGAVVSSSGELTPFAGAAGLVADSAVEVAALEDIAVLADWSERLQPTGAAAFRGRHELRVLESGALDGTTRGTLVVSDLATAAPAIEATRFELGAEIRHELVGGAAPHLSGHLRLQTEGLAVAHPDGAVLGFGALDVELEDIDAGAGPDGALDVRWRASMDAEQARFSGRLEVSVDLFIEMLHALQYLAVAAAVDDVRTGLDDWSGRRARAPLADVEISRLSFRNQRFDYDGGIGTFSIALDTEVEVGDVRVRAWRQRTRIETLALSLDAVRIESSPGAVTLAGDVRARAVAVAGDRRGGPARSGSMAVALEGLRFRSQPGELTVTFSSTSNMRDLEGTVTEFRGVPWVSYEIEGTRLAVEEATLTLTPEGANWLVRGQAEAIGVGLGVGRGLVALATVDRIALGDLGIDEDLQLEAGDGVLGGLRLNLHLSVLASILSGEMEERQRTLARSLFPSAPAEDALVEDVQWLLAELGHDPGPRDGVMGPQTGAAIEAFQAASGRAVDGRATVELREALLAAARPGAGPGAARAGHRFTFDVASIAVEDGARVDFVDDTVEPVVDVNLVFDTLTVANLSTADPERAVELRAVAEVNEFSRIEAEGRVTPFVRPPEVDLRLRVSGLELPPYSPYVRALTGVVVEEGVLDLSSDAKVSRGAIDGEAIVDVRWLEVETLSEEDAERLANAIGIPVETAVRLLKDAEGRIELTIPVSGTLEAPEVDLSTAVNRAVVGVLAAIFPPNVIARIFRGAPDEVAFEPVVFAPNSSALDGAAIDYLDRLADFMTEHAEVAISLCGRASAGDVGALTRMLGERLDASAEALGVEVPEWMVASWAGNLAVERARAVRRYLVDQGELAAARTSECRPVFDPLDEGPPRVEIRL